MRHRVLRVGPVKQPYSYSRIVLGNVYEGRDCSVARVLEVVGERWTLLIVTDALRGARRFHDFLESMGIARNVLSARLYALVDNGVMTRVRYQHSPPRYEYLLTDKGRELALVVIPLMQWGDRYLCGPDGPPVVTEHRGCGGRIVAGLACESCGDAVRPGQFGVHSAHVAAAAAGRRAEASRAAANAEALRAAVAPSGDGAP